MVRVNILVENSRQPNAIVNPLVNWLNGNGIETNISQPENLQESFDSDIINIWALRDDILSIYNPSPNDFALAAVAPEPYRVLHPAVSISSSIDEKDAIKEFGSCTWMCSDDDGVKVVKFFGGANTLILSERTERVAYHTALCIMVPEVFTLFEAGKQVIENNLPESKVDEVWNQILSTAKRTTQLYTKGHYHGPVARLDKSTLDAQFSLIKKSVPWIFPLYSESIQYRVSNIVTDRHRIHDVGLSKYFWDTKSKNIIDEYKNNQKELILESEANEILTDLVSIMPCRPSLVSLTFFKLERSDDNLFKPSLKGDGFFFSNSEILSNAFKNQIKFFLSSESPEGISTKMISQDINELKPFIVVNSQFGEKVDFSDNELFKTMLSTRDGSINVEDSKDYKLYDIKFGSEINKGEKDVDGWFPLDYNDTCELIIPIFRFNTDENTPLLEGLITIVSSSADIVRFTPSRINEIQNLALKRYVSLGHVERLLNDFALGDKMAKLEEPMRNVFEYSKKLEQNLSMIEDVLNPYRFWVADAEMQNFASDLKKIFTAQHDISRWTTPDYDGLRVIWEKHRFLIKKQLGTSFFPELYSKYFSGFDSLVYSEDVACAGKALSSINKVPLLWLANFELFVKDNEQSNKVLSLEQEISSLPFIICLEKLKGTIKRLQIEKKENPKFGIWGQLSLELRIEVDRRGETGLFALKDKSEKLSNSGEYTSGLSAKHTSHALALLYSASSNKEFNVNKKGNALCMKAKINIMEVL